MSGSTSPSPVPRTFLEYLRSFGPGVIIVLTWLGAGDVVEAGVSGANYGYALMWIIVVALLMRFLFVSLIAFLEQKGWRGPQHRRVQIYDFLLTVVVMIILDLAIWTLGAELVHDTGRSVHNLDDLTRLLTDVLGETGRVLFHLGVFAAVFTSVIGHAVGLGAIGTHAHQR